MNPEDLANQLDDLTEEQLRERMADVVGLLEHPLNSIRFDAAGALGRVGHDAADALRKRLRTERNPVVLSEIITALGEIEDAASALTIERILAGKAPQLVRSAAANALAEIQGHASKEVLLAQLKKETSRRVRASIACSLAWLGCEESLQPLRRALRSKDPIVRHRTANLLGFYEPKAGRTKIIGLLEDAVVNEVFDGIRADMIAAIDQLKGTPE